MFEIEDRRVAKVKIYGVEYSLQRPSYGEISRMQQLVESMSDYEKSVMVGKILINCGMPQEILDAMASDDVVALFEFLTLTKKK